jgi:membrane-associated phospholipid phosphatase
MMYLGWKFHARSRWFLYVVGVLLIVATVYQRYHYVIDLIAGAAFAVLCIATSARLYHYLKEKFQTMESRFVPSAV